jgi:hypothetical protein
MFIRLSVVRIIASWNKSKRASVHKFARLSTPNDTLGQILELDFGNMYVDII